MSHTNTHEPLQVNKEARILRHRRLWENASRLNYVFHTFGKFFEYSQTKLKGIIPSFERRFSPLIHWEARTQAKIATPKSLKERMAALALGLFLATGFMSNGYDASAATSENEATSTDVAYIVDQEGYFTKANPQTATGQRVYKEKISHTVEQGENLSLIASHYGLKTDTLLWENGLSLTSTLRIGQKLVIPPTDGVSYTVASGESIDAIAQKYKIEKSSILAYNSIENAALTKGQVIFLPNAKPQAQDLSGVSSRIAARAGTGRDSATRTGTLPRLNESTYKPVAGKFMIFPTVAVMTQGFHPGHYGYDLANRSKPPVWASAAGKVVKASSGTWGGGYGNHVIIDHGNGVQTLYAHMEYLTVKVGDKVTQGQVIGKMGRTGNVRGVTGIHLHFEVIDHGKKRPPGGYY